MDGWLRMMRMMMLMMMMMMISELGRWSVE